MRSLATLSTIMFQYYSQPPPSFISGLTLNTVNVKVGNMHFTHITFCCSVKVIWTLSPEHYIGIVHSADFTFFYHIHFIQKQKIFKVSIFLQHAVTQKMASKFFIAILLLSTTRVLEEKKLFQSLNSTIKYQIRMEFCPFQNLCTPLAL